MLALMKYALSMRTRKRDWFRQAADRGDAYAQYRVGRMYARGRGAPRDYRKAYFWFSVAAASGDLFQEDYAWHRDEAGRHLSQDERAEARLRAERWRSAAEERTPKLVVEPREA